jgi:hypothetical protein
MVIPDAAPILLHQLEGLLPELPAPDPAPVGHEGVQTRSELDGIQEEPAGCDEHVLMVLSPAASLLPAGLSHLSAAAGELLVVCGEMAL